MAARLNDTSTFSLIASPLAMMSTSTRYALASIEAEPADDRPVVSQRAARYAGPISPTSHAIWGTPVQIALYSGRALSSSPGDLTKQVIFSIVARSRELVTACSQPAIMQRPSVSPPQQCFSCSHGSPALRISLSALC